MVRKIKRMVRKIILSQARMRRRLYPTALRVARFISQPIIFEEVAGNHRFAHRLLHLIVDVRGAFPNFHRRTMTAGRYKAP